MRRKKNSGFSLIELMIVIAVIGILLSIAAISGTTWLNRYRVEAQMKQMYVDLMNARVSAMSKNRMYFVDLAATQYTIYEDRDAVNPALDGDGTLQAPGDRQVMQKSLDPRYSLTLPVSRIDFDSRGLAETSPLIGGGRTIHVTASYGSANDCIVISRTRIRMGAWDGASCNVQ